MINHSTTIALLGDDPSFCVVGVRAKMKNQDQNFTKRKSLTGGTRLRFSFARFTMNFSTADITLAAVGTENASRATVCGRRRQFGSRVVVCLEDFCVDNMEH